MAGKVEQYNTQTIKAKFADFPSAANLEGALAIATDQSNAQYQAVNGAWASTSGGAPASIPADTTANASRDLAAADKNATVNVTGSSPVALKIKNDTVMGASGADTVTSYQIGTGVVTFVADTDVTLDPPPAGYAPSIQNATRGIKRRAANTWAYVG